MRIKFIKTGEILDVSESNARELVENKIAVYVGLSSGVIPHEQQAENEMRNILENTMIRHKYVEK